MVKTKLAPALDAMDGIYEGRKILSKPFLEVCKSILPIIDKFSEAGGLLEAPFKLAIEKVKTDIDGNIKWLERVYLYDHMKYKHLHHMISADPDKAEYSVAVGLLWLTRAMDFLVKLFGNLLDHPHWTLSKACTDSYNETLGKWHNTVASALFWAAMNCAPDRRTFMELIGCGSDHNDMKRFRSTFAPILKENHNFLESIDEDE